MKTARGYRAFRGATVDQYKFPLSTTPNESLSRISYKVAHFSDSTKEPYSGLLYLKTDGAGHINVKLKNSKGITLSTLYNKNNTTGTVSFVRPPSNTSTYLEITISQITTRFTVLSLVHDNHLQSYQSGQTFTPDIIRLWKAVGSVVRFMKLLRADDNPASVIRGTMQDLYWTGNASERYSIPYEAILKDCKNNGITPWINILANVTDQEVLGLTALLEKYPQEVIIEFANEVFHAPKGGSPYTYFVKQAQALWGTAGTGAPVGRQYLAYRYSFLIDLIKSRLIKATCKFVYADQGNWSDWLKQTFVANLWQPTTPAEINRKAKWVSGSMIDMFVFNNYYGEDIVPKGSKPGFISLAEAGDPVKVYGAAIKSIDKRVNQIGNTIADIKDFFPNSQHTFGAYESGMSDTANNFASFRNTQEQTDAHLYWLNKSSQHLSLNMHYADVDASRWHLVYTVKQRLRDTARGRAVETYLSNTPTTPPIGPVANNLMLIAEIRAKLTQLESNLQS
jgi:hypothetical protein